MINYMETSLFFIEMSLYLHVLSRLTEPGSHACSPALWFQKRLWCEPVSQPFARHWDAAKSETPPLSSKGSQPRGAETSGQVNAAAAFHIAAGVGARCWLGTQACNAVGTEKELQRGSAEEVSGSQF